MWILASVVIAAATLLAARAVAPGGASNVNEAATVVVAEVYAILIVTLYAIFGGSSGASTALRVRPVPGRAFAIAFVIVAAAIAVVNLAYTATGVESVVVDNYLRNRNWMGLKRVERGLVTEQNRGWERPGRDMALASVGGLAPLVRLSRLQ